MDNTQMHREYLRATSYMVNPPSFETWKKHFEDRVKQKLLEQSPPFANND